MAERNIITLEQAASYKPQELLNHFFELVPFSPDTVDTLQKCGCEPIYSFGPFEPNGTIEKENILLALENIHHRVALSDGHWQLLSAKQSPNQESDDFERDRTYFVLKRSSDYDDSLTR